MIPEHRQTFNAAFSPARYQEMLADIDQPAYFTPSGAA